MAIAKEYQVLFDALERGDIDDAKFRRLLLETHLYLNEPGIQDNRPKPTAYDRLVMAWEAASDDDRERFTSTKIGRPH